MKEETKENLLIYGICIAFVVITIAVIINIIFLGPIPDKQNLSENLSCEGKDIFETSNCLKNELSEFFNYNISNKGKDLNLSQLKEQGGVCRHYADYYMDNFLKLGARAINLKQYYKEDTPPYYVSEFVFPVTNKTSHVITIVSNEDGWCSLDQLEVKCWKFK